MAAAPGKPLIAGKIHGVRSWSLGISAGEVRLVGAYLRVAWENGGRPTTARCEETRMGRHADHVPHRDCGCGLYAWHPSGAGTAGLFPDADAEDSCAGIVEAWGRVEVHRDGFRAQHARPAVLVLPSAAVGSDYETTVRRLAEQHRAEVAVVPNPQELERYCRERNLGLSPGAVAKLLPGEDDEPSSDHVPVEEERHPRFGSLRELAGAAMVGLVALLWYGGLAVGAVLIVLALMNGSTESEPDPHPAAAATTAKLEALDTRLGSRSGFILYATRVRNASERRAAVDVRLDGRLVAPGGQTLAPLHAGHTDQIAATIGPGDTGVVLGWVQLTPARRERLPVPAGSLALRDATLRSRANLAVEGRRRPLVSRPRFDRRTCVISARVAGPRSLTAANVRLLAFRGARPMWATPAKAGPLAPSAVRQALYRVPPAACAAAGGTRDPDLEVYPDLTSGQLEELGGR